MRPIDGDALWERLCKPHASCEGVIDSMPTLSLNTLRDAIYEDAVAHGLWEGVGEYGKVCPCVDVDIRFACSDKVNDEANELDGAALNADHFTEELADVIIMSLSVAGKLGIDIDAAVRRKMEINKGRPWKHGKDI